MKRFLLASALILVLATWGNAQLSPGPSGANVPNLQTPLPPAPGGGSAGILNYNNPVTFNQETQVALDPVNPRDIVPFAKLTAALPAQGGSGIPTQCTTLQTAAACIPVVTTPPSVQPVCTRGTNCSGSNVNGPSGVYYFVGQNTSGSTQSLNQTISNLGQSVQWALSAAGASFPISVSTTTTLVGVNSTGASSGTPTMTVVVSKAIPSTDTALLMLTDICNANGFVTPTGWTSQSAWGATLPGCINPPYSSTSTAINNSVYTIQGGISAGTVYTVTMLAACSGYCEFDAAIFDVSPAIGTPTDVNPCNAGGLCTDGNNSGVGGSTTVTSLTARTLRNNDWFIDSFAILGSPTISSTLTSTYTNVQLSSGAIGIFPFFNPGTSVISQSVLQNATGLFLSPAWQNVGACTLVAGTCTVTFAVAYVTTAACTANGITVANAMAVANTLTGITIKSSSGTDTQSVIWLCSGS